MYRYPVALTIAGSDSGGGAGIQADIKTFSSLGVFGASAITAITAQNTQGVRGIQAISPEILRGQIEAILEDFIVDAIKIGMLHNKDAVKVVSETLPSFRRTSIILDPVMISTSGSKLLEDDAIRTIIDELFPKATLLTPNIPETEYLSGIKINNEADILCAARKLQEKGCNAILIKGGIFRSRNGGSIYLSMRIIRFVWPRQQWRPSIPMERAVRYRPPSPLIWHSAIHWWKPYD